MRALFRRAASSCELAALTRCSHTTIALAGGGKSKPAHAEESKEATNSFSSSTRGSSARRAHKTHERAIIRARDEQTGSEQIYSDAHLIFFKRSHHYFQNKTLSSLLSKNTTLTATRTPANIMDLKQDQLDASGKQSPNINIAINGEPDVANVKNMALDANNEGRVGLSKEELMKYANQPFWVRLRNILFASFWVVWLAILVVAVGYVINSPSCVKTASAMGLNTTTPEPAGSRAS